MEQLPFRVDVRVEGWTLVWADLEATGEGAETLPALRDDVACRAAERFSDAPLSSVPAAKAMRLLFRTAGTDPTKYRPSSEALLRRLVKGEPMPAINPLVDISNCLSAELVAPVCVMESGAYTPPFEFRFGVNGEHYESLRGPFRLDGRPLLCDANGPLDTPITGNARVKVTDETRRAMLVAYLPAAEVDGATVLECLEWILGQAPVARILGTKVTG